MLESCRHRFCAEVMLALLGFCMNVGPVKVFPGVDQNL